MGASKDDDVAQIFVEMLENIKKNHKEFDSKKKMIWGDEDRFDTGSARVHLMMKKWGTTAISQVSWSNLLQMQPTIQEAEGHPCHPSQLGWLWLSSIR